MVTTNEKTLFPLSGGLSLVHCDFCGRKNSYLPWFLCNGAHKTNGNLDEDLGGSEDFYLHRHQLHFEATRPKVYHYRCEMVDGLPLILPHCFAARHSFITLGDALHHWVSMLPYASDAKRKESMSIVLSKYPSRYFSVRNPHRILSLLGHYKQLITRRRIDLQTLLFALYFIRDRYHPADLVIAVSILQGMSYDEACSVSHNREMHSKDGNIVVVTGHCQPRAAGFDRKVCYDLGGTHLEKKHPSTNNKSAARRVRNGKEPDKPVEMKICSSTLCLNEHYHLEHLSHKCQYTMCGGEITCKQPKSGVVCGGTTEVIGAEEKHCSGTSQDHDGVPIVVDLGKGMSRSAPQGVKKPVKKVKPRKYEDIFLDEDDDVYSAYRLAGEDVKAETGVKETREERVDAVDITPKGSVAGPDVDGLLLQALNRTLQEGDPKFKTPQNFTARSKDLPIWVDPVDEFLSDTGVCLGSEEAEAYPDWCFSEPLQIYPKHDLKDVFIFDAGPYYKTHIGALEKNRFWPIAYRMEKCWPICAESCEDHWYEPIEDDSDFVHEFGGREVVLYNGYNYNSTPTFRPPDTSPRHLDVRDRQIGIYDTPTSTFSHVYRVHEMTRGERLASRVKIAKQQPQRFNTMDKTWYVEEQLSTELSKQCIDVINVEHWMKIRLHAMRLFANEIIRNYKLYKKTKDYSCQAFCLFLDCNIFLYDVGDDCDSTFFDGCRDLVAKLPFFGVHQDDSLVIDDATIRTASSKDLTLFHLHLSSYGGSYHQIFVKFGFKSKLSAQISLPLFLLLVSDPDLTVQASVQSGTRTIGSSTYSSAITSHVQRYHPLLYTFFNARMPKVFRDTLAAYGNYCWVKEYVLRQSVGAKSTELYRAFLKTDFSGGVAPKQ